MPQLRPYPNPHPERRPPATTQAQPNVSPLPSRRSKVSLLTLACLPEPELLE
jgi:hypothetical protein